MPFEPGSILGAYEILAAVGSTGDVYTASDTRLNRKVVLRCSRRRSRSCRS